MTSLADPIICEHLLPWSLEKNIPSFHRSPKFLGSPLFTRIPWLSPVHPNSMGVPCSIKSPWQSPVHPNSMEVLCSPSFMEVLCSPKSHGSPLFNQKTLAVPSSPQFHENHMFTQIPWESPIHPNSMGVTCSPKSMGVLCSPKFPGSPLFNQSINQSKVLGSPPFTPIP